MLQEQLGVITDGPRACVSARLFDFSHSEGE